MTMVNYTYQIFVPSGNDTALVLGNNFTEKEILQINNDIMAEHENVEQVGFVSTNPNRLVFFMAGGGFCGNGTRAAVSYFLNGKPGQLFLTIPGVIDGLRAGISESLDVWTEVPLHPLPKIEESKEGYYIVRLPGVSHLVIPPSLSAPFLFQPDCLKQLSLDLLASKGLIDECSCGVIYTEKSGNAFTIHPFVHDYGVNTMIQETACGSGTVAVALLQAIFHQIDIVLPVYQPSGEYITASVTMRDRIPVNAIISGKVYTNNSVLSRTISID